MRIGRWLLGPENAGLLMGNDAAGKTTLLYRLKLGQHVQVIPTIGFNIETMEYSDGGKITLWDVGGCDKIRPLIRHYIEKDRFIIFIHDCVDNDRLDYSLEHFHAGAQWLSEAGGRYMWALFNKQDLLQPSEREKIVNGLRSRFESESQQYQDKVCIKIMDTPGLSAATGAQLDFVMKEIRQTLKKIPQAAQKSTQTQVKEVEKGASEQELIERVHKANSESVGVDQFWNSFLLGDLDAWDHYSHLRAGFFVLLEGLSRRLSLLDCTGNFLSYLDDLIQKNPERFRNTAHRTMTAFWLYHIHLAAVAYKAHKGLDEFPSRADFGEILLFTPSLMNSGLWRSYYSKDLLFSPEARENWHLPDLRPLPSFRKQKSDSILTTQKQNDESYRLPRFAFAVVQKSLSSKLRRGGVVKQALETLQTSTIRLRAANQSIPPYSETQAYFWVQLTHALLKSLEISPHESQTSPSGFDIPGTVLTFEAFKTLFDLYGNEWTEYYSQKAWESVPARMSFVNPDRKPLPNVFASPSSTKMELARLRMVNAAANRFMAPPELPSQEELEFAAAVLIDEANLEGSLNMASHASLLQYLHRRLVASSQAKMQSENGHPSGSAAATAALELAQTLGSTQSVFWVQQAQISMANNSVTLTFEEFITKTPRLAYEDLPLLYYSPELWWSTEAKEVFMPPDRRPLSSIVSKTGFN